MSDTVISVENLSKSYLIGHQGPKERYTSLRDTLASGVKNFARRTISTLRGQQMLQGDSVEEFWALRDLSFEVKQGEVLGIIGRNGAGKSTLLKVLSRITEPTHGRVTIDGRVASLLEVGTGFHPELTGRENIFLNGAVLGMTRREIKAKFDEIVDFAGVEKFLDTPVKRYSSGMYVRLAFAVAAHLEPEILIVDEVLAVGDAEFQRKCMGKMQDVAKGGRTVLFVSHQLNSLRQLCTSALLLANGRSVQQGEVDQVMSAYRSLAEVSDEEVSFEYKGGGPSIIRVAVNKSRLAVGDLEIEIDYKSPFVVNGPVPGLVVYSESGDPVYASNSRYHQPTVALEASDQGKMFFSAPLLPLLPGKYRISVWLGDWHQDFDSKLDCLEIDFLKSDIPSMQPPTSVTGYINHPGYWRC